MMALLSSFVGFFGSPKMTATSVSSFSSTSRKNVNLQKNMQVVGVNNRLVDAVGGPKRHNLVVMSSKNGSPKTLNNDGFSAIKEVVDREPAASSLGYTYEIENMVAEAFSKVGRRGAVVTIKGGKHAAKDDSLYLVEGMKLGHFKPYFVTNSTEEMSFDVENCKLLLVDKITNAKDLTSVLKDAIKGGYPILIIARDIQQEALDAFVASMPLGAPKIAVIKQFGFVEISSIDDIALLTRATVIREGAGLTLENVESEVLGFAAKVVVTADGGTTIVGDGSTKESLNREAEKIRELVLAKETAVKKNGPAESIKEIIRELRLSREITSLKIRLVRLSERVAVIEVGAETEKEYEEKKQRFDAALNKIKVLSSNDPNYGYDDVAIKKTVEEERVAKRRSLISDVGECARMIFDIVKGGPAGWLDPIVDVDNLMDNIEKFTMNMLSYDEIVAERLLEPIDNGNDLVRCMLMEETWWYGVDECTGGASLGPVLSWDYPDCLKISTAT